jgi:hypothetical protein
VSARATSGVFTAGGGLAGLVFPKLILQLVFGVKSIDGPTMFFVRHWGALLFVACALTVYAGFIPAARVPILTASILEKCVIVGLIFSGPIKRTGFTDDLRNPGWDLDFTLHRVSCRDTA